MVSVSEPEKVRRYLEKNDYIDVYIFLITSLDNLENRARLLRLSIDELEEKLKEALEKVSQSPGTIRSGDRGMSSVFKSLHYSELEIIQRLNVVVELLAVYYHMARTDLKKLPTSIGRGDFGGRELYSEFEYFNSQGIEDIWANYRYPNVDEFSELSPQEGEILKGMLTESARTILGAFKEVYLFQKDFREVYNKYKHTLSELTGVYGIDKDRKLVQTHIYVRHKENGNLFTYIVPVSADEVAYFRKISEEVYVLLETLIDGALLGLANQGGKFVPRTLLIKPEEHDPYRRIFERIRSCVCPEFSSKMIVNPPSGQDLERVNDAFRVYHIYRMERDVLNTGDILKEGLAFSR